MHSSQPSRVAQRYLLKNERVLHIRDANKASNKKYAVARWRELIDLP